MGPDTSTPSDGRPVVGAVVLYYDRGPDVIATLESLSAQSAPVDEVILFDNASPTRPADGLGDLPDGVRLVRSAANLGYAAGMGEAVRLLERPCDRYLLLTHDVRLDPGCLEALGRSLDRDERIGVVGPLIGRRSRPDAVYSGGGQYRGRSMRPCHRRTPRLMDEWPADEVHDVSWLDGSTLMVRREAFDAVGGLDPTFFLYVEDVDLAERLRAAGWGVRLVTGARSWEESAGTDRGAYLASLLELHRRHHGWGTVAVAVAHETETAAVQILTGRRGGARAGRRRVRQIGTFLAGRAGLGRGRREASA